MQFRRKVSHRSGRTSYYPPLSGATPASQRDQGGQMPDRAFPGAILRAGQERHQGKIAQQGIVGPS
jgi:hypothetical protein